MNYNPMGFAIFTRPIIIGKGVKYFLNILLPPILFHHKKTPR